MLSEKGDIVLDPFVGRGTTLLEARLMGRMPLVADLNPIAVALTRAKNATVRLDDILLRIDDLEQGYDALLYVPEASVQADDIMLIYHPRTLAQLCYLKRQLLSRISSTDEFLVGVILGIMHGGERQDGSSSYASISMPNTFSMSPDYVRRFVATKRLQRIDRNVFQLLRDKVRRLCRDSYTFETTGVVLQTDAKQLSSSRELADYVGGVDLVVTSPPYLNIVNYARQNWIRSWFLSADVEAVSGNLDDNLTLSAWLDFMQMFLTDLKTLLHPNGTAVLVIGDVSRSTTSVVSLARELLRQTIYNKTFSYVGCLSDHLQADVKTTRIWKDTKGKATLVDRVVILSNSTPTLNCTRLGIELFGDSSVQIPALDAQQLEEYAYSFMGYIHQPCR